MMGYYGNGMGWGGWLAMSLSFVVFWGLLIALVVWLVRSFRHDSATGSSNGSARANRADEVLAERFARGEIDDEEFNRRRELLHSSRSSS